MMPDRAYVLRLAALVGAALAVVATVNIAVDPFDVWRVVHVARLNDVKTPHASWEVISKIACLRAVKPRAIILGSSRARLAMDPQSPIWRAGHGPAYNAGVPGGAIGDIRQLFGLAVRLAPVKVALVELHFHGFDVNAAHLEMNLKPDDPRLRAAGAVDLLPRLILADSLRESWETLRRYSSAADRSEFFQRLDGKIEFHAEAFDAPLTLAGHERYLLEVWLRGDADRSFCLRNRRTGANSLAELDALLTQAREHGVQVKLILAPVHARQLALMWAAGLRPQFEHWKREMVRMVADRQSSDPASAPELWDFTRYSEITTEGFSRVAAGQRPNAYFWEPIHYKDNVGTMILDAVSRNPHPTYPLPPDFGLLLTLDNVEAQLASERAGHEAYRQSHLDEMAQLDRLVADANAKAGGARLCK